MSREIFLIMSYLVMKLHSIETVLLIGIPFTTIQQVIHTTSQTSWSLNVWGVVVGNHVVGPYFFEGNLYGEIYLDFIVNQLPILLEEVPLNIREQMWFLHDGAPAHHNKLVRGELNDQFGERWIGRDGPVRWPPMVTRFK